MYHYFSEKRVDNHFLGIGLKEILLLKFIKIEVVF